MNNLTISYSGDAQPIAESRGDVNFRGVWKDTHPAGVEPEIRAERVVARHSAMQLIKVQCLSGSGWFAADGDIGSSAELTRGTVIALEPSIPHEVSADSEMLLLVTNFK